MSSQQPRPASGAPKSRQGPGARTIKRQELVGQNIASSAAYYQQEQTGAGSAGSRQNASRVAADSGGRGHHNNHRHQYGSSSSNNRQYYADQYISRPKYSYQTSSSSTGYSKEQYLLANAAQIVVRPPSQLQRTGYAEYRASLHDADILVDWELIEFIKLVKSEEEKCPICLEFPTCAKITKCGHVYCYSCILQYLDMGDHPGWRKCPMCSESVHRPHLKSVVIESQPTIKQGDIHNFSLMQRPRDSIVPWRKMHGQPEIPQDAVYPVFDHTRDATFSHYSVAYQDAVLSVLHREKVELKAQLSCLEQEPTYTIGDSRYVILAMQEVECREKEWKDWSSKHLPHGIPRVHQQQTKTSPRQAQPQQQQQEQPQKPAEEEAFSAHEQAQDEADQSSDDDEEEAQQAKKPAAQQSVLARMPKLSEGKAFKRYQELHSKKDQDPDFVYYYQLDENADSHTAGQQHVYLHPLMSKILAAHYGHYSKLPDRLTQVKVLEIERLSLDPYMRKRYAFLGHVPLWADIAFVEVDLTGVVPANVLQQFAREIKQREQARLGKKKREEDDEKRIKKQEEEERQKRFQQMEERQKQLELTEKQYPGLLEAMKAIQAADQQEASQPFSSNAFSAPLSSQAVTVPSKKEQDKASAAQASPPSAPSWGSGRLNRSLAGEVNLGYMPSLGEVYGKKKHKQASAAEQERRQLEEALRLSATEAEPSSAEGASASSSIVVEQQQIDVEVSVEQTSGASQQSGQKGKKKGQQRQKVLLNPWQK